MATFESESVAWVDPYIIELTNRLNSRKGGDDDGGRGGSAGRDSFSAAHRSHYHDDSISASGGVLDLEDDSHRALFEKLQKMHLHREASSVGSYGVLGAMRASAAPSLPSGPLTSSSASQQQQQLTGPVTQLPAAKTESMLQGGPPEDPYTHVACANDTFVAITGRTGMIHFFHKDDDIPRHSLELYGISGAKDSGAPPAGAAGLGAATAGSGGISGVNTGGALAGLNFLSNLVSIGGDGAESIKVIDSKDAVVKLLLDPMGRHAVVIFASGSALVYHIRRSLAPQHDGMHEGGGESKNGKKGSSKKGGGKKSGGASSHEVDTRPVRSVFNINNDSAGISGFILESIGWNLTNNTETNTDTVIFGSRHGAALCTGRIGVMGVTDAHPLYTLPQRYATSGPIHSIAQYVDDGSCGGSARSAFVLVAQGHRLFYFSSGPVVNGTVVGSASSADATADTTKVLMHVFSSFTSAQTLSNFISLPTPPAVNKHHSFYSTVVADRSAGASGTSGGGGGGGGGSNTASFSMAKSRSTAQQEAATRAVPTASTVSLVLPFGLMSQRRHAALDAVDGTNAATGDADDDLDNLLGDTDDHSGGGRSRRDANKKGGAEGRAAQDGLSQASSIGGSVMRFGSGGMRSMRGFGSNGGNNNNAANAAPSSSSPSTADAVGADSPLNDPPMCFTWSFDHWFVSGVINLGIATLSPAAASAVLTYGSVAGPTKDVLTTTDVTRTVEELGVSRLIAGLNLDGPTAAGNANAASAEDGGEEGRSAAATLAAAASSSPYYGVPSSLLTLANVIDVAAVIGGYEALQWQQKHPHLASSSVAGKLSTSSLYGGGLGGASDLFGGGGAGNGVSSSSSSPAVLLKSIPSPYSPASFYAVDRILGCSSTYFHTTITTTRKQYTLALPPFLTWEAANRISSVLDCSAPSLVAQQRHVMHALAVPPVFANRAHYFVSSQQKLLSSCVSDLLLSVSVAEGGVGVGVGGGGGAGGGGRSNNTKSAASSNTATLVNAYRPYGQWPPPPDALVAMQQWSGALRVLTDNANGAGGGGGMGRGFLSAFNQFANNTKSPQELLANPTPEAYSTVATALANTTAHEARNRMLFETVLLNQAQRAAVAQMDLVSSGVSSGAGGRGGAGVGAAGGGGRDRNMSMTGGHSAATFVDPAALQEMYQQLPPLLAAIGSLHLIAATPAAALAPGLANVYGPSAPAGAGLLLQQCPRSSGFFNGAVVLEPCDLYRYYILRFGGKALTEVTLMPHRKHFAQMMVAAAKRGAQSEMLTIQQRMGGGGGGVRGAFAPTMSNNSTTSNTASLSPSSPMSPILKNEGIATASTTSSSVAHHNHQQQQQQQPLPPVNGTQLFNMAMMLLTTPLRACRYDPFRQSAYATVRNHLFSAAATAAGTTAAATAGVGGGGGIAASLLPNGGGGFRSNIPFSFNNNTSSNIPSSSSVSNGASSSSSRDFAMLTLTEEEDLMASLPRIRSASGALMMNQLFLNTRYAFAQYLVATGRPVLAAHHFARSTAADTRYHLNAAVKTTTRGREQKSPYGGLNGASQSFNSALTLLAASSSSATLSASSSSSQHHRPRDPTAPLLVAALEKARILMRTRAEQNKALNTHVFDDGDEEGGDSDDGDDENEGEENEMHGDDHTSDNEGGEEDANDFEARGRSGSSRGGSKKKKKRADPPPLASPALHCLNTWAVEMLLHRSACEEHEERLGYRQLAYVSAPHPTTTATTGDDSLNFTSPTSMLSRRASLAVPAITVSTSEDPNAKKAAAQDERAARLRSFKRSTSLLSSSSSSASSYHYHDPLESRLLFHYGVRNAAGTLQTLLSRSRRTLSWAASQKDVFAMGIDGPIIHFCAQMKHYNELLQYQIANDRHFEAVVFLINFCSDDHRYYNSCWVRYSYDLIRRFPVRLIQEGWIKRGAAMQLDPLKLIPAIMAYRQELNDTRLYAEGNATSLIEELEFQRLTAVVRQQVEIQKALDGERTVPIFRPYGHMYSATARRQIRRAALLANHHHDGTVRLGRAGGAGGGPARRSSMYRDPNNAFNTTGGATPFLTVPSTAFGGNHHLSQHTSPHNNRHMSMNPQPQHVQKARSLSLLLTKGSSSPSGLGGGGRHASTIEGSHHGREQVPDHQGISFLKHVLGLKGGAAGVAGIAGSKGAPAALSSFATSVGGGAGGSKKGAAESIRLLKQQCLFNLLLHLLATSTKTVSDQEVVAFIDSAHTALDKPYAYRVCMQHGRYTAALHILFALGFLDEAVDEALELRDVATAVSFIKRLRRSGGGSSVGGGGESGRMRRRELWKKVIAFVAEDKVNGAQHALNLISESNGDINVSHVLPFLSGEVVVSTFERELNENVSNFGDDLANLHKSIAQSEKETEGLKAEQRHEASLRYVFSQQIKCAGCNQQVLSDRRPVFFRRCRHVYHTECYRKGLVTVHAAKQLLDEERAGYAFGHLRPPCEGDMLAMSNHSSSNNHPSLRVQHKGSGDSSVWPSSDASASTTVLQYLLPPNPTDCFTAGDQPDLLPNDSALASVSCKIALSQMKMTKSYEHTLKLARAVVDENAPMPPLNSAESAATANTSRSGNSKGGAASTALEEYTDYYGVPITSEEHAECYLCEEASAHVITEAPLALPITSTARGFKLAGVLKEMTL